MHCTQATSRRGFLGQAAGILAASATLRGWLRAAEDQGESGDELLVRSKSPFNAEPKLQDLVAETLTPVNQFYIRNHGPVPKVAADPFTLRVEGLVNKPRDWNLAEIPSRFRLSELEATLTCAGNRRLEMSAIKPVAGVQWAAGAIGHARWSGVALASVLEAAEIQPGAKHVWFEGLDPIQEKDGSVAPFGGSIPLERALAKESPVLLAQSMNGKPLTAEHGFPLRSLVPGYIGARSVKWLTKITVSDRPSPNHYVAEAYKLIQTGEPAELAAAEPLYEFPVNAAIGVPSGGSRLPAGRTTIAGYALPGGGASVAKVELSLDGGQTWRAVKLAGESSGHSMWRLWSSEIDLPAGRHELVVRATDSRGSVQPEKAEWNLKGYLYNAWHRVAVEVA